MVFVMHNGSFSLSRVSSIFEGRFSFLFCHSSKSAFHSFLILTFSHWILLRQNSFKKVKWNSVQLYLSTFRYSFSFWIFIFTGNSNISISLLLRLTKKVKSLTLSFPFGDNAKKLFIFFKNQKENSMNKLLLIIGQLKK